MPARHHSPESVVQTLQELAKRLGKNTLTKQDVKVHLASVLGSSSIKTCFQNLGNALDAAGLQRNAPAAHLKDRGFDISNEELFESMLAVEKDLGRIPNGS